MTKKKNPIEAIEHYFQDAERHVDLGHIMNADVILEQGKYAAKRLNVPLSKEYSSLQSHVRKVVGLRYAAGARSAFQSGDTHSAKLYIERAKQYFNSVGEISEEVDSLERKIKDIKEK